MPTCCRLSAGAPPTQGKFYAQFDDVVLLTAPAAVIAKRLATRTNNPFGMDPDELARTLLLKQDVEPLLRHRADLEVDTTTPLDEVVTGILRHVR
jgi:shikimate kinase